MEHEKVTSPFWDLPSSNTLMTFLSSPGQVENLVRLIGLTLLILTTSQVTSILSVILNSMDQVNILSSGFSALSYFCENGFLHPPQSSAA